MHFTGEMIENDRLKAADMADALKPHPILTLIRQHLGHEVQEKNARLDAGQAAFPASMSRQRQYI